MVGPDSPPAQRKRQWRKVLRGHRYSSRFFKLAVAASAVFDIGRQLFPWWRSAAPMSFVGGLVESPTGERFRARALSDDLYILLPRREFDVHEAILSPLEPGDTFLDVGANVGYYAVNGRKRVGRSGRVIAVEAWPRTAAQLRENLEMNGAGDVVVIEAAATAGDEGDFVGFSSRRGAGGLGRVVGASRGARVPARTLDDMCRSVGAIRVMKIDVEGGELAVLRGAQRTLERTDIVVVEYEEREPVALLLTEAGFQVSDLQFTTHLRAERVSSPSRIG